MLDWQYGSQWPLHNAQKAFIPVKPDTKRNYEMADGTTFDLNHSFELTASPVLLVLSSI